VVASVVSVVSSTVAESDSVVVVLSVVVEVVSVVVAVLVAVGVALSPSSKVKPCWRVEAGLTTLTVRSAVPTLPSLSVAL